MKTPRGARGALAALIVLAVVLAGFLIAAIGVDSYHVHVVRTELQNACDAAALAGAQDLWFNIDNAANDAYRFASLNKVEGVPVASTTPGVTVNVVVTPPAGATPGRVEVTATKEMRHLFARLIGRHGDTIQAKAAASTSGLLWRLAAGQAFPICVSLDAVPAGGQALKDLSLGQTLVLDIKTNACFTSITTHPVSASLVKEMVNGALGLGPNPPGLIPSVATGQDIYLINGMLSNLKWDTDYAGPMTGTKYLILPVVTGTPAYNQTRKVVGFVGLQVLTVAGPSNTLLTGKLVNPGVIGEAGPEYLTGNPIDDAAIARWTLHPITLVE